jgi:4-hydroxybenzoate polyprenyltransferase
MKKLLQKTIDLFLYSNFFIALCAAFLTYQTFAIFGLSRWNEPLAIFTFCATLFIYSLHRIIGFTKLDRTIETRRISVILNFQTHILIYAFLALVGMISTIFFLPLRTLLLLALPGVLSALYIMPIFNHRRRFRDLPYLKVFTVGIVWTWVCVLVPMLQMHISVGLSSILLVTEKLLFLTAITIPFDIRDMEVDALHKIKTLPAAWGISKIKIICEIMIFGNTVLVLSLYCLGIYSPSICLALVSSYLISAVIIANLSQFSHDYWYSGILDGTILLQSILVIMLV